MDSKERHNYYKLVYIVLDIVSEALREVFKNEWNTLYGPPNWNDDVASLHLFQAKTNTRRLTPDSRRHYNNLKSGNCKTWDITLLNYVLVYSQPIGFKGNPAKLAECNAVGKLKDHRNNLAHINSAFITDVDFNTAYNDIEAEILNFGHSCNKFVLQMQQVKHDKLSGTEIKRLENDIAIEKEKRCKEIRYQRIERAFIATLVLICLYQVYVYFVPPALPAYFPEELPSTLGVSMNEVKLAINAVNDGTRVIILHGHHGYGKFTAGLMAGDVIRKQWLPFPWYIVAAVKFDGSRYLNLQKNILEAFYIHTETNIAYTIKEFFSSVLKRRNLIIINNVELGDSVRFLINDLLKWNKLLQIIVTCNQPLTFVDFQYKNIPFSKLTREDSMAILKFISTDLNELQLEEISEICDGWPLHVKSVGVFLKHSPELLIQDTERTLFHVKINTYRDGLKHIFPKLSIDLQIVVLSMWYTRSVSLKALILEYPYAQSFIEDIVSTGLGQIISNKMDEDSMWSSHVSLNYFAEHVCKFSKEYSYLHEHCRSIENAFQIKYRTLVLDYASRLWSVNDSEKSQLSIPLKEQLNVDTMLYNRESSTGFMPSYFSTLEKASSFYLFGIQDHMFSGEIFFPGTKLYRYIDIGKFLTLLFLLSGRGDIYFFNHPDKYEGVTALISDSLYDNLFDHTSLPCEHIQGIKELGMCYLTVGYVISLFENKKELHGKVIFSKEEGLNLINKAIKIFSDHDFLEEKVYALSSKGLVYLSMQNYAMALSMYMEAHNLLLEFQTKNVFLASSHYNIAYCYFKMGQFNLLHAVHHFMESYLIFNRTIGLHHRTASPLVYHGICLEALGKHADATDSLKVAREIQKRVEELHPDLPTPHTDKAGLIWTQYSTESMNTLLSQYDTIESFKLYVRGNRFVYSGDWEKAESSFNLSLDILHRISETDLGLCPFYDAVKLDVTFILLKKETNAIENSNRQNLSLWNAVINILTIIVYSVLLLWVTIMFCFIMLARNLTIW